MYFSAFLGHFEVEILEKYVKFCENSQSTKNIYPWSKLNCIFFLNDCDQDLYLNIDGEWGLPLGLVMDEDWNWDWGGD